MSQRLMMNESKHYFLWTGVDNGKKVYHLINKQSGHIEAEDIAYPKVLILMREYERVLESFENKGESNVTLLKPKG